MKEIIVIKPNQLFPVIPQIKTVDGKSYKNKVTNHRLNGDDFVYNQYSIIIECELL